MAVAAAAWAVDTAEVVAVDTAAVVAVAMVAVAAVDTAAPRPPLARKPAPAPRLAPVAMADTNLDMGKFPFVGNYLLISPFIAKSHLESIIES